jgi:hypothetical protein
MDPTGPASTTMSNAPVAAATIPPVEIKSKAASRWLFVGALFAAATAAAAFLAFRATTTSRAPTAALAPPVLVTSTVSVQASASPMEATLYLDGRPLPSNPYTGRIEADGTLHLLRAEAPGYANGNRAFVADREITVILALARTTEPPRGAGKKARSPAVPSAAPAPSASTISKADDCNVSPYYVDDRNIKVVRPECLRPLQSR